jgi:hypothetical protein
MRLRGPLRRVPRATLSALEEPGTCPQDVSPNRRLVWQRGASLLERSSALCGASWRQRYRPRRWFPGRGTEVRPTAATCRSGRLTDEVRAEAPVSQHGERRSLAATRLG